MKTVRLSYVIALTIICLFVVGCGGKAPVTTQVPEPIQVPVTNTPVPTANPNPTMTSETESSFASNLDDFQLFESSEEGVSIYYPNDWVQESGFFNLFASSENLLESPDLGEDGGAVLLFGGSSEGLKVENPIDGVQSLLGELEIGAEAKFVNKPVAMVINGQNGATATLQTVAENGTPLSALAAVVMVDEQTAVFVAITPTETQGTYFPIFTMMLNSLSVYDPGAGLLQTNPYDDLPKPIDLIFYGTTVEDRLNVNDVVVYEFLGLPGERIDITVTPSGGLDIIVDIVDGDGNSIMDGPLDESFGTESVTDLTLTSTDSFFIVLSGFDGSAGEFALTLTAELGTAVSTTLPVSDSIQFGETVESSVPVDGEALWLFTAVSGDVLNLTVTPKDGELDAIVDIINTSGHSILENGPVDNSFGTENITGQLIEADGAYTIVIRDFANTGGDFELVLNNNESVPATEETIVYGGIEFGSIVENETKQYQFVGNQGDFIDVTARPLGDEFDLIVDIWDSAGKSILNGGAVDQAYGEEFIRTVRLPESGSYTIVISGFEGSIGNFELQLNPSNGGVQSTVLVTYDAIGEPTEVHEFPFTSPANETVTVIIKPEPGFDVIIELYALDTGELLEQVDATTGFEELIFEVTEPGDYAFTVLGYEGSMGDYEVNLISSHKTRFVIAAHDDIYGRFGNNSSITYWYNGTAGETIRITLQPDNEINGIIRILNENDQLIRETNEGLLGDPEQLSYEFQEDALIAIEISQRIGGRGEYQLFVTNE